MIYDKEPVGFPDGQWHCPFQREWVETKARAAKDCELMTAGQIEAALLRIENGEFFRLPPVDFLSEEQDARGLPLSWCEEEKRRYKNHPTCCTAIYDYDSIPDVMISNGHDDWPLKIWEPILKA